MLDTRPGKEPNVNASVLHAEWRERARHFATTPEAIVDAATGRVSTRRSLDQKETATLIDRAIEAISERQSTWRPNELQRELAALLATDLGVDATAIIDAVGPSNPHRPPALDDRSPSRRILDQWQGREPHRTVNDYGATGPARPDSESSEQAASHIDAADATGGNEELRRRLRQLRHGRQGPSFGPEIEL